MRCKTLPFLLTTACLFVAIPFVRAFIVHPPPDLTLNVPVGMKVHFGDYWLYAKTGSVMHVTDFWVDNWLIYDVDGAGVQQVYNGTKPHSVWIDGLNTTENSGWTYWSGIIEVTTATTNVAINWAMDAPPPPPYEITSIITLYIPANETVSISESTNTITFTPSDNTLVGLNFTLYFAAGGGEVTWYNYYPVNFTCTGTFGNLIVTINDVTIPAVNGRVQAESADTVIISWSWPMALTWYAGDLMTFIGIGGLCGFFVTPVYTAYCIKNKDYGQLKWCLVIGALCFGLMLGWLVL